MGTSERGATGVLVMRAWTEDHDPPLRVRILHSLESAADDYEVTVVASPQEAAVFVLGWLESIAGREPPVESG